jgi:hypothetical protein
MTRRESRKIKLRKQREAMQAKGYKQIQGRWVRENSQLHHELTHRRWS